MSNAQRQKMGLNARKVVEDGFGEEKLCKNLKCNSRHQLIC